MELSDILRSLLALIFVIGLILGCAALARMRGWIQPAGRTTGERRLGLVETLVLDPRHRLMLVRIDNGEALVLLGPGGAQMTPAPPSDKAADHPTDDFREMP